MTAKIEDKLDALIVEIMADTIEDIRKLPIKFWEIVIKYI